MPTIIVDGISCEVDASDNLLEALLGLKKDLPYFCWHPALDSIGSCRQCAVVQYQNEEDQRGRIVMACMTPVTEGAIFSLDTDRAVDFRSSVIENLMINHPHDCPVCEEGGECHLQDMTVMSGHDKRAYRWQKKTHRNQYLGPLINHEMNRCITCYRCVRFYRDYAGGSDLAAFASHDNVYFGRYEEGVLASEFAGNLVEVCPTGVFTDKTLSEKYTRKWDLQSAPSVCTGCGLGCNTIVSERYGELRRIHNRFNNDVNGYFLCDRGRFGGGFVNNSNRIPSSGVRNSDGKYDPVTPQAVLERISALVSESKSVIGIGSPRASIESNYMLRKLVGEANFYTGQSVRDQESVDLIRSILTEGATVTPNMREVEQADAVLVLGEDLTNTSARLALSVRQMVRNEGKKLASAAQIPLWHDYAVRKITQSTRSPLMLLTCGEDRLDDVATVKHRTDPASVARLGYAIANRINPAFTGVADLSEEESALADRIAETLKAAINPIVISGNGLQDKSVIQAAANVAWALAASKEVSGLIFCVAECNSMGVSILGNGTNNIDQLLSSNDKIDVAIVMENDLQRRAGAAEIEQLLARVGSLIVIDQLDNDTLSSSDICLPAASFAETEGTLVNNEGRAQRFFSAFKSKGDIKGSWQWLLDLGAILKPDQFGEIKSFDDITIDCATAIEGLAGIAAAAPSAKFRNAAGQKVSRMTHRASGRTAQLAHVSVHEPQQPADDMSALAYTMEGASAPQPGSIPASLQPHIWAPGWNSNNAIHKFQKSAGGALISEEVGVMVLRASGRPADLSARFDVAPQQRSSSAPTLQLVPRYHLMGSDEMTSYTRAIRQLTPQSYFAVSLKDAAALGVGEADGLEITAGGQTYRQRVVIDETVASGCVLYPAGFSATMALTHETEGSFSKASGWEAPGTDNVIKTDR